MSGGAFLWGWYPTGAVHVEVQVDGVGVIQVYDTKVAGALALNGFQKIAESWQPQAIDPAIWTPTHPATNPLAVAVNPLGINTCLFDVEDAEVGRLIGLANSNRWRIFPTIVGVNHLFRKIVMEWEVYFNNVANIAPATAFMGLVTTAADTRVSNNIVGFGLLANTLVSITDRAGVEEANTGFGDVLEDTMNLLKMEISHDSVLFYVNGTLVASHVTPANLPDQMMYPCWYMASAALGASTFEYYLGAIRIEYIPV